MYADDLAVVADSAHNLQAMLNVVYTYTSKWRYQLNADKSVVMVIGESASSQSAARETRSWSFGDAALREADEQHHLGVLRSVYNSSIHRTNERASAYRCAFYALNSVGSRFEHLHPLTSLRLYRSLCIPILLYGADLWCMTKSQDSQNYTGSPC